MRHRATRAAAYQETVYAAGSVKITYQLAVMDPDDHQARDGILGAITRYLAEDPTVRTLLAGDPTKANAFLGGLVEAVNSKIDPGAWEGDAGEIAARILREASRRGMGSLYVSSGRSAMDAATG